jgi:hypothetical protein
VERGLVTRLHWAAAVILLVMTPVCGTAGDEIDVDQWHREFNEAIGQDPDPEIRTGPSLGLYPTLGGILGPPNWYSWSGAVYVSASDGKSFSLYAGYGFERGPRADAEIYTLGWGGVRSLPVASKQTGFHGKYLRYRRWDDEDHGIHHGLSIGTEHGVGFAGLSFEVGAARSTSNHWMFVAQVSLKLALPVRIPLSNEDHGPREH